MDVNIEAEISKNEKFYGSCSSVIGGKVKNLNIKKIPKLLVSDLTWFEVYFYSHSMVALGLGDRS